ncbi:MAG: hypothetical protein AAF618_04590 [Pseudomonadota bacterium]
MQRDSGALNCTISSFLMAGLIGVLATVVFRFFVELSWPGSIFLGGLIIAALGIVFGIIFCRELPALDQVKTPGADAPLNKAPAAPVAEAAAPAAAPAAAEPAPAPEPAPAAPVVASEPAPAETDFDGDGKIEGTDEGTRPAALEGPRDGGADNLKEIKGIGPKLEKLCNTLGFYHFDQIANWTPDEVAWVDANLEGFKGRVTRDEWVSQAKILAAGGETEFSQRVDDGKVY